MSENIQKAKQGFGNLLNQASVGSRGKGKGKGKNSQLPQISYFEVDDKTGQYVRVFASLLGLDSHEMRVKIGSDTFVLSSAQDLTAPGCIIGNILRFYAYAKVPKQRKELFALPQSAFEASPASAAEVQFSQIPDKDREAAIEGHPAVKSARKGYEGAKSDFTTAFHDLTNFVAEQAKLGKSAPGMQGLLDTGTAEKVVACLRGKEQPATKKDLRPRIAVTSPDATNAAKAASPGKGQSAPIKVPKKRRKSHERNMQRLFPGKE